jgi:DNA primase
MRRKRRIEKKRKMQENTYDIRLFLTEQTGSAVHEEAESYRVCCCFHADTSFDLIVNKTTGRYYCFCCGASGKDLVDFVMQLHHVTDLDEQNECALDILYDYTEEGRGSAHHIHTTYNDKVTSEQLEQRKQHNLAAAKEYYKGNFNGDATANKNIESMTAGYNYLAQRGITDETIKHFRMIDWRRFRSHPLFIPYAYNGECFGYELRRIESSAWPKTLAMFGTEKSDYVHGFTPDHATFMLVTEGALDQALTWQYGWREQAQASIMGSSVSEKQAALMAATKVKYYISAFDQDSAGEKAHQSFVAQMKSYHVKILRLNTGMNGLSFITRKRFVENLDMCLKKIKKDHTAVLCEF